MGKHVTLGEVTFNYVMNAPTGAHVNTKSTLVKGPL